MLDNCRTTGFESRAERSALVDRRFVRLTVESFQAQISRLNELSYLPELGEEVSRLATVAKYLPDDDRPGLLSLIMVRKFDANVDFDRVGDRRRF